MNKRKSFTSLIALLSSTCLLTCGFSSFLIINHSSETITGIAVSVAPVVSTSIIEPRVSTSSDPNPVLFSMNQYGIHDDEECVFKDSGKVISKWTIHFASLPDGVTSVNVNYNIEISQLGFTDSPSLKYASTSTGLSVSNSTSDNSVSVTPTINISHLPTVTTYSFTLSCDTREDKDIDLIYGFTVSANNKTSVFSGTLPTFTFSLQQQS